MLWVLAGLAGLVSVAPRLDQALQPGRADAATDGLAIPRAPDGQFYTDAQVGDAPVRMLIDPRADKVLLSGEDARRLGLGAGPGFAAVKLPKLAVGGIEVHQVEAVIAPDLPVSLLGQSYLNRIGAVRVESERMILR